MRIILLKFAVLFIKNREKKMNLEDAEELTLEIMDKYGLLIKGWSFEYSSALSFVGRCCFDSKIIKLSSVHTKLNSIELIRDTALHEVAHALAGFNAGHGPAWKKMCVLIGAKPKRCAEDVNLAAFQILSKCKGCGKVYGRQRMPKREIIHHCSQCTCRTPLVWRKNAG